jgi:opacity protein-like surface antigen
MKLYSRYGLVWGFIGAIVLGNTAIALAQDTANYIGLGATDEGFAVNAKIELAEQLSLRPAVLTDVDFDDDTEVTVIAPVTYDFESPFKNGKLLPFAGAGIGGTTRDDGEVGLTVIGGADYRASDKLTANGSVVYLPYDDDRVNVMVGLGYNF